MKKPERFGLDNVDNGLQVPGKKVCAVTSGEFAEMDSFKIRGLRNPKTI